MWLYLGLFAYAALLLVQPRGPLARGLNALLLLIAALPLLALLYRFGTEIFLGWHIVWYLMLQAAYGVWSPFAALFLFAVVLWLRFVAISVFRGQAGESAVQGLKGPAFPIRIIEKREVRCPAGQTTNDYRSAGEAQGGRFVFAAATCQACPWRPRCVRGQGPRTITIQAEEGLQQHAPAHNQTEAGRQSLRERVVVEHRIARLVQLGIRKSRYFGRTKTCLQVVMAAVVANLSLVVGYCKRQAEQAGTLSAAAPKTGLLGAVLVVWTRIFVRPEPVPA